MERYWLCWLLGTFATFITPESIVLATGHPERTLSWWVWKHAQVVVHQPVSQWSAAHVLFAGVFLVLVVWLSAHLILGWWR